MLFDPYAYDLARPAQQPPLAAEALLEVPAEARAVLWRGLTAAVEGALDLWECLPSGHRSAPLSFSVQHAGKPRFDPAHLRTQTLSGWHRLMGIELRLAAQALEELIQADSATQRERLAEQCIRVGQLYDELKRRARAWMARATLDWELRMLRYRASPVLAPPIYD